jgi:hypothetical protein
VCGVRRANTFCSVGRCLRYCEKFKERCAYRNHNVGKLENISTTNTTASLQSFGTLLHQIQNTDSFRFAAYNFYRVQALLKEFGLSCYTKLFDNNGFNTLESIAVLTDDMLIQMGISLFGHRAALLRACKLL